MRLRRVRRRWIVMAVVLVVALIGLRLADKGARIDYYRIIDDHTLVAGTASGPLTWIRVTALSETSTTITIGVSSISVPAPGFGGDRVELPVTLTQPVAGRTVIDASRSSAVDRTCGSLAEPFTPCL
jgi:hypothetical protein